MRIGIVLLATSLALVASPIALADEAAPDCEPGQDWVGYESTDAVEALYEDDLAAPAGPIAVCEGEQWDGQDTVRPDQAPSCSGGVSTTDGAFVGLCLGPDINQAPNGDVANPVGLRVSTDGSSAAYVAANIALVGRAVVHADGALVAVYIDDNTLGNDENILANVITLADVTQGHVDEGDCDQTTYAKGARENTFECGRDNTAITVEHHLLA